MERKAQQLKYGVFADIRENLLEMTEYPRKKSVLTVGVLV
jgi:hypothetical protein